LEEPDDEKLIDFESGELKSSTRINFDDSQLSIESSSTNNELTRQNFETNDEIRVIHSSFPSNSSRPNSTGLLLDNDEPNTHSIGSESTASTVVNANYKLALADERRANQLFELNGI
jgi:hypothetical protein